MPKRRSKQRPTSKKAREASPQTDDWFFIKDIVDERVVGKGRRRRVEYRVDWEGIDPDTGKPWEPTWVQSQEVNSNALEDWEKVKTARLKKDDEVPLVSVEESQDSQPPRPSNWRKVRRTNAQKIVRPRPSATTFSATPSEEPESSIISTPSLDSEVAASLLPLRSEADAQLRRMTIEILKDSQFDPSEYLSAADTQATQQSSEPISTAEDRDERLLLASQLSSRTVPDSQDPSGSAWSQPQTVELVNTAGDDVSGGNQSGPVASADSRQEDIPSHQVERPPLPVPQYTQTSVALESLGELQTGDSGSSFPADPTAAATTSPVFATQPVNRHAFDIPESSSVSQLSMSSSHAPVPVTSPEKSQPSGGSLPSAVTVGTESQDAQMVPQDAFTSQLDSFPGSNEFSNDVSIPSGAPAAPAVPSVASPVRSPDIDVATAANTQPPDVGLSEQTVGRLSTAEELSELFNLESTLDIPSPTAALPDVGLPGSLLEDVPGVDVPGPLLEDVPSVNVDQPVPSSLQSLKDVVDAAFAAPTDPTPSLLVPDAAQHVEQSTVSPADISRQAELITTTLPLPIQEFSAPVPFESSREDLQMGQVQDEEASSVSSSGVADLQMDHVVTLPFAASLRPLYNSTLVEFKADVTRFGTIFNNEIYVEPDSSLVERVDQLLGRLDSICNYPPDIIGTTLESLPPVQLAKYACDSNAKFNFLFELMQGLRKDTKILIVARSVELLKLLSYLAEAAKVECICEAIGKPTSDYSSSAAQVTLSLPDENTVSDFDVVIGFDRSFTASTHSSRIACTQNRQRKPLLLLLVTTHSIEHIDLHVPSDVGQLERKNVLLSGVVRARKLVLDPDRGYPEPFELAGIFGDFLNGETDAIMWEPVPLPDDVLDVYLSSQPQQQSQMPAASLPTLDEGRKRKHDDSEDDPVKRLRTTPPKPLTAGESEPPLPDEVQALLKIRGVSQVQVQVPLGSLQVLAERFAEYERVIAAKDTEPIYKAVISGLEQRVKEYERTNKTVYISMREALEDRAKAEAERKRLEAALQNARETASRDNDKAQKRISELEATVARLTADPEGSETPLAKTNKALSEAQDKVQMLEKRLENAHADNEYVRNLYQAASSSAGVTQAENEELKKEVAALREKSDGRVRIHEIQAEMNTQNFSRQIRELKTIVRERELEIGRVREELRQLRNGRRETRQVSVPRSPRTGMSPRHGRAYGGSASRGTSPAPAPGSDGVTLPTGNGRWAHLRD